MEQVLLEQRPRPALAKVRGLVDAARLSTRVWFDLLPPATMMLIVRPDPPAWRFAGVLAIAVLFHAAGNYFNDLADTDVDRSSVESSRRDRALLTNRVTRRELFVGGWAMILASIAIAILLPWPSVAILVALLLMALAYNFEPIHLAARPLVLQVFWPAIWALMYALCASAMAPSNWRAGVPFVVFVAVFMGLGEGITQDVRDVDNDAAGGRRTTPVVFGVGASVTLAWVFQAISLGAWIWFAVRYPLPLVWAVLGGAAICIWLVWFGRLVLILRRTFDKPAARMTHVAPMFVLSATNLCALIGVLAT